MTKPTSDAQSSGFLPRRPQFVPSTSPIPSSPAQSPYARSPITPPPEVSDDLTHDRALDFASHSWDLATGGLKTLTAKRDIPSLKERRSQRTQLEAARIPRSYTVLLVIVACVLLMLVSIGFVLFSMFQP